jgi:hypothetical protein
MFHILKRHDQRKGAIATVEFEGEPYGAGVSFLSAAFRQAKARDCISIPIPKLVSWSPVKRQWSSMGKRSLRAPATASLPSSKVAGISIGSTGAGRARSSSGKRSTSGRYTRSASRSGRAPFTSTNVPETRAIMRPCERSPSSGSGFYFRCWQDHTTYDETSDVWSPAATRSNVSFRSTPSRHPFKSFYPILPG